MWHNDRHRRLIRLLERERQLLTEGRLPDLAGLADEKERLLAALDRDRPDAALLRRIQAAARRNADLLRAVQAGLIAARARIDQIVRGATFETYTPCGDRRQVSPNPRKLHRRA